MTAPHFWACLGVPPLTPPCGASGGRDSDAEKHTKATGHGTSSGTTESGVQAVLNHVKGGR